MIDKLWKEYPITGLLKSVRVRWEIEILNEVKSRIQALWDWWIPVTERLPEWELTEYLVFTNYWTIEVSTFYDLDFIQPFSKVTHWMPLPNNPK